MRGNEINNADETSNNCILCARPVSRSIYRSMKLPGLFLPRRKPFGVYGGVASPAMKIPFPRSPSPPFNRPRSQNFPSCSLPRGIKRNGPKGHRAFHALDIRLITFSLRFPRRRHDRLTRTTFPWEKKRKFLDGLPDRSRAKTRNATFLHSPRLRSSLRLPYVYLRLPCASPSIVGAGEKTGGGKWKVDFSNGRNYRRFKEEVIDRLSVIAIVTSTDVKKRFLSSFPQRQFLGWPDSWRNRCLGSDVTRSSSWISTLLPLGESILLPARCDLVISLFPREISMKLWNDSCGNFLFEFNLKEREGVVGVYVSKYMFY